jgi:hypothetical protein|tara:strand:- start:733 stop:972 length:240 start_codon:yes stop_codon:yes gene_type:complete
MIQGDLVHIPQDSFLICEVEEKMHRFVEEYLKTRKPILAIFMGQDPLQPSMGSVYYREQVWSMKMADIYPLTEEDKDVS